ncbi:hypothetical protein EJB05_49574, partial [Eragrostis curvula]
MMKISYGGPATGSSRDLTGQSTSLPRPKHRHSSVVDGSGLFFFPNCGRSSAKELAELQVSPHAGLKHKVSNNLQSGFMRSKDVFLLEYNSLISALLL